VSHVVVDLERTARLLDLDWRLKNVPSTAMVRGVFFNLIEDALRRRGLVAHPSWRSTGTTEQRTSYGLYPARDLIVLSTTAGSLVKNDPVQGMREIHASTATYYASTWYGRAFRRLLRPDPSATLSYIDRSRSLIANYGLWRWEPRGFNRGILHMFEEYCFIESIQRGGLEGMLTACGVRGEVRVELDSPFNGRLIAEWEPVS
jgi:uncharacterized protein (TIGR02265 family)